MAERQWTREQKQAIESPANILVNAAAGSGKTAVLVERILHKLIPDEEGRALDMDQLLVVTFARDAAAEMQQRIRDAVTRCAQKAQTAEQRKHFRRQLRLLAHADITTIDSFCVKAVRNHFHLLGIDPGFGIMDNTEVVLLKEEIMDALFDKLYEEADNAWFLSLTERYPSNQRDGLLKDMVLKIYDFTRSLPNPEEWMAVQAEKYHAPFPESFWMEYLMNKKKALVKKGLRYIGEAVEEFTSIVLGREEAPGPGFPGYIYEEEREQLCSYWEEDLWSVLVKDYETLKAMENGDWDQIYEAAAGFSKIAKGRGKAAKVAEKNQVLEKRNRAAEIFDVLAADFALPLEQMDALFREELYPVLQNLTALVRRFGEAYLEKKEDRGIFEFNDLEHLCLKLFTEFEEIRQEYQKKYEEILMDEYQDTNGLQEAIFSAIARKDNRFMVGDMKQSIYRFRNSDPTIFKSKDALYAGTPEAGNRIILYDNFRSRSQVLESINLVFDRIMSEAAGEIAYDASQRLRCGNKGYEIQERENYASELYVLEEKPRGRTLFEEEEEEAPDKIRLEARFIAGKIRELLENRFQVLDNGTFRDIRKKDIAILASSVKSISAVFTEELSRAGLDCFAESEGYFERSEIKLMMSLVKIINNPYQDIPLLTVLRSPLFQFSEDELAAIRLCRGGSFYDALTAYAKETEEEKAAGFLRKLEQWRECSTYMSADKLIWTLYTETSLYDLVGVLYGGEEAQANLRLLFEKARQYEKTGFKGLFHFIRFAQRLQASGTDMSGAKLISENQDVVRIMTIHKSKGLEFPVVFLSGMGKSFLRGQGETGRISLHKDLGFGMDYVDCEKRFYADTVTKGIIKSVRRGESISEEMRKLYVAMTRAKEKLFVIATVKGLSFDKEGEYKGGGLEEAFSDWEETLSVDGPMNPEQVLAARGYLDWIGPVVQCLTKQETALWKLTGIPYGEKPEEEQEPVSQIEAVEKDSITDEMIDALMKFSYPYENSIGLPSKISVTQLKQLARRQEEDPILDKYMNEELPSLPDLKRRPAFLEEQALTGAELGTAYHNVMAYLPIIEGIDMEYVAVQIEDLREKGILTNQEACKIQPKKIADFFQSELGRELSARSCFREQPFEVPVSAARVYREDSFGEETLLLQGVIDCYYETPEGTLVLVDYKTDHCRDEEELKQKYASQLLWYQYALERMTGKKVTRSFLYSFHLECAVLL